MRTARCTRASGTGDSGKVSGGSKLWTAPHMRVRGRHDGPRTNNMCLDGTQHLNQQSGRNNDGGSPVTTLGDQSVEEKA